MPAPLAADLVVAADWSVRAGKRWMAIAARGEDGRWRAGCARPVGRAATLVARVARRAGRERAALVGLDLAIGLPASYARRAGVHAFVPWALGLGAPLGTGSPRLPPHRARSRFTDRSTRRARSGPARRAGRTSAPRWACPT